MFSVCTCINGEYSFFKRVLASIQVLLNVYYATEK